MEPDRCEINPQKIRERTLAKLALLATAVAALRSKLKSRLRLQELKSHDDQSRQQAERDYRDALEECEKAARAVRSHVYREIPGVVRDALLAADGFGEPWCPICLYKGKKCETGLIDISHLKHVAGDEEFDVKWDDWKSVIVGAIRSVRVAFVHFRRVTYGRGFTFAITIPAIVDVACEVIRFPSMRQRADGMAGGQMETLVKASEYGPVEGVPDSEIVGRIQEKEPAADANGIHGALKVLKKDPAFCIRPLTWKNRFAEEPVTDGRFRDEYVTEQCWCVAEAPPAPPAPGFKVDMDESHIYWNGQKLGINRQSHFQVLAKLIYCEGQTVPYRTLLGLIKPQIVIECVKTMTEAPEELKQAVSPIRTALRKAGCPRKIDNFPKTGYRLLDS